MRKIVIHIYRALHRKYPGPLLLNLWACFNVGQLGGVVQRCGVILQTVRESVCSLLIMERSQSSLGPWGEDGSTDSSHMGSIRLIEAGCSAPKLSPEGRDKTNWFKGNRNSTQKMTFLPTALNVKQGCLWPSRCLPNMYFTFTD